ncbi:MAG: ATP-grasp domain-containing protein [Actinobacteria bacterium]|nr:ATP-grasp domain-containing protein [Actinomycetota bacterium]
MSRILLILPSSTYRATDFLDAARSVGAEIIVASDQRQTMSDTMGDRAVVLDLDDPDLAAKQIVAHAERVGLDAIVAVDDRGVLPAATAAGRLGMPHNPPEAVAATRDKATLRDRLDGHVSQPAFRVARPGDDVGALAEAVELPCVVKPVSLSASRGVIRADTADEAIEAADRIRHILSCSDGDPEGPLLVEAYVPGREVAVEGLLRGGVLDVLAIFDKPDPLEGPYFEETLYVTPSRLTGEVQQRIVEVTADAATAIGLREGPIHAEARVRPDGEVVFLELAARSIGGLCSRALRFGLGVTLEEILLLHALGRTLTDLKREPAASGVMMLPIPQAGTLQGVDGRDEAGAVVGIVGSQITVAPGSEIEPLPEGDRYLGFLFARGETPEDVERSLREAAARLDVRIEP